MRYILAICLFLALLCPLSDVHAWEGVVVHITDSTHMTKAECDSWHNERGWDGCGYNYVIEPDGSMYAARGANKVGAHAKGYNSKYLGVAFVSKNEATKEQLATWHWWYSHNQLPIYGHNQFSAKRCPGGVLRQIRGGVG